MEHLGVKLPFFYYFLKYKSKCNKSTKKDRISLGMFLNENFIVIDRVVIFIILVY